MSDDEAIRQAYVDGCARESGTHRACVEWYVEELALPMERAEELATQAYLAASRGDLRAALGHVRRACRFERQEYADCSIWRPLRRAIGAACRARSRLPGERIARTWEERS